MRLDRFLSNRPHLSRKTARLLLQNGQVRLDGNHNTYKVRFQIEFLFRDAKQFLGLNDCQARQAKVLRF
ncbi:MAG: hypothetical protein IBX50_13895 [Marinospirillum sp.]|uniref:S4 domain-containing protein n=1 Tax=Marinospirillum sp. TaxID=2183934 RepID=UPI0019F4A30C|nr:S4 domain-containing protein [Marinospirillum sp.]MBE0507779.1 hypothetical protein [Marinospirillum sp.]